MGKDGAVAATSVCLAQKEAPGCWAGESDYYHKDVDADQDLIILMSSLIIITRGWGGGAVDRDHDNPELIVKLCSNSL